MAARPVVQRRGLQGVHDDHVAAQTLTGALPVQRTVGSSFVGGSSDAEPALVPEAATERKGGVEDPRLVIIGSTSYLTYTACDGKDAQPALAGASRRLLVWAYRNVHSTVR